MSVNLPFGKQRPDRVDGRLFLTDDNIDHGALTLLAAARRLEVRMREAADHIGLSPVQFAMLLELRRTPGLDVAELRARIGGTVPTIARLLGTLDKQGFINRPRSGDDGRRRALALTERGREIIDEGLARIRPEMTRVYRNAGEPSVSGALDLLDTIAALTTQDNQS